MIKAAVCTIGDEILIGQIVDTNSSHIAQELNKIGVKVQYMDSFGDQREELLAHLTRALEEYDIVVVTGGLGPTKDDITKAALAELFGSQGYYQSREQYAIIARILTARGVELSDNNRAQALVPQGCEVILNPLGTAPCMVFQFDSHRFTHAPTLYALPGVPFEAQGLLPEVMAHIQRHRKLEQIHHKTLVTFGIAESMLAKMIAPWEDALPPRMHLAYLPNPTLGVRLRLSVYGGTAEEELPRIDLAFGQLRQILGDAVYGEGADSLPLVIGRLLQERGHTVATAESCTGGRVASLLTSVPGSSAYYMGSVVSYHNEVKHNVLNVPKEIIAQHGAVSRECVEAMALGVRSLLNTTYAVATSGIAGPGGGSPEKPVGTAWLAVASQDPHTRQTRVVSRKVAFQSTRAINIERFAANALNLLRLELLAHPRPTAGPN